MSKDLKIDFNDMTPGEKYTCLKISSIVGSEEAIKIISKVIADRIKREQSEAKALTAAEELIEMYKLDMTMEEEDAFSHYTEEYGFQYAVNTIRQQRWHGSFPIGCRQRVRKVEDMTAECAKELQDNALTFSKLEEAQALEKVMNVIAHAAASGRSGCCLVRGYLVSWDGGVVRDFQDVVDFDIQRESHKIKWRVESRIWNNIVEILKARGFKVRNAKPDAPNSVPHILVTWS